MIQVDAIFFFLITFIYIAVLDFIRWLVAICSDALIVIDAQNDFVLPESTLCVAGAMAAVPMVRDTGCPLASVFIFMSVVHTSLQSSVLACARKVDVAVNAARRSGVPVLWVCREHHASGVRRYRELVSLVFPLEDGTSCHRVANASC